MELSLKHQLDLVCVVLFLPALCSSIQESSVKSRATYYRTPDGYGNPRGACGFGEYGRTVNGGSVTAVSGLWKGGSGCGACYQVWCQIPKYCDDNGAHVVVTDYGEGDRTDFIMSPRAFLRLGRNANVSAELFKYGVVDIEYKRVPCKYPGHNIVFHVLESSNNPGYFSVVILNVGGTYDITSVELWQEDCREWIPLRRAYGAVFDFANPPSGKIFLRFQLSGKWVYSKKRIPSDWKAGADYDTGIQLY